MLLQIIQKKKKKNVLWQRIMEPINVRYENKPIILNITVKALHKA